MVSHTRRRAEWYASDVINLLWKKTGHMYTISTVGGEVKSLSIVDDTDKRIVITYTAKTWVNVCDKIVAACETYRTIMDE